MPTDHADVKFDSVRVPDSAILGRRAVGWRLRRPSSTRTDCDRRRRAWARPSTASTSRSTTPGTRETFGAPLATRQAVQWPLVELYTEATMLRSLIRETAADLDSVDHMELSGPRCRCATTRPTGLCDAADRAMQVHGGVTAGALAVRAHLPPPPPLPHHRGREEIQMRRVAGHLFGFTSGRRRARSRRVRPAGGPPDGAVPDRTEDPDRCLVVGRWDSDVPPTASPPSSWTPASTSAPTRGGRGQVDGVAQVLGACRPTRICLIPAARVSRRRWRKPGSVSAICCRPIISGRYSVHLPVRGDRGGDAFVRIVVPGGERCFHDRRREVAQERLEDLFLLS